MRGKKFFKKDDLKGLVFATLVSFSIWIYSVLNSEYSVNIKVPLTIIPPEKHSVSGRIPDKIDVLISAVGWQILNLTLFPKSAVCNVPLEQVESFDERVIISKNDFIKGITLGVNAKILDVSPSSLILEIGRMVEKVVPVEPDISITPRDNFVLVGSPIIRPQYVVIRGRSELVSKIEKWKTMKVMLKDVYKPLQIEVPLSDTLHSQISLNVPKVMVYVDVDLAAEKTIYDVPVIVEGGTLPEGHIITPTRVKAIVRSGVNKLIESDLVFLDAKVKYSELIKDTIGIFVPQIEVPPGMTLVSIDPPYLYHWRVTNSK
ncbi:MAG: hypothetical protein ACPLRO_01995 [Candidatus Kapaibacteriota bacterium]